MLVAVWEEIDDRNKKCKAVGRGVLPTFPRIILGLEEINITYSSLNSWWRQDNGYHKGLAPGVYALDQILCAGRAAHVNAIIEGQDVTDRTISGAGAGTVNIAVRILAEYDQNAWKRLAHGHDWIQPISHKAQPGWSVVVHGLEVEQCQRFWFDDGEPDKKTGVPAPFEAYEWLTAQDTNGHRAEVLGRRFPMPSKRPQRMGRHDRVAAEGHAELDAGVDVGAVAEDRRRVDGDGARASDARIGQRTCSWWLR